MITLTAIVYSMFYTVAVVLVIFFCLLIVGCVSAAVDLIVTAIKDRKHTNTLPYQ